MPGPSFSWSAFSNSASDAVLELQSDRLMTLVVEVRGSGAIMP